MTKKCVLIISFCLSVLIVSCSQSERVETVDQKDKKSALTDLKLNNEAHTEKNNPITKRATKEEIKEKLPLPLPISQAKNSITFNGEKYIFTGEKLQKGTEVRHINMSESGVIKGTLVIVTKAGEIPELSFKHKTQIAKDTYRIIPDKTADLMTIYHQLRANESIENVELEVIYNAKNGGAVIY